ncbi:MAG: sulfatase family protein [Pirellula sp.]
MFLTLLARSKPSTQFLALLIALLTSALSYASPPNILLIVADDLGYRDLGCYGATKVRTPRIDQLADEGVRFTDAHSICGTCMPSRYAILSGTYFYNAKRNGEYSFHFHEGQETLPSLLKSVGFRTAAIGKWHNGFGRDSKLDWNSELKPGPMEIGFDSFFGTPRTHNEAPHVFVEGHRIVGYDSNDPISIDMSPGTGRWGKTVGGAKAQAARPDDRIDLILVEKAGDFLAAQTKDKPFFLYLAFAAPHTPINPAPEFRSTSQAGVYGDYVQMLDHCTGQVLDALDKTGLTENTIVIFTSDNGGRYERAALMAGHRTNGELLGQKTDCWEGGHRVPMIARWPGHIPTGSTRSHFFLQLDLMATLAEATQTSLPKGAGPDGSSELLAFTHPDTAPAKRMEGVFLGSGTYALRQDDWLYIPKQGSGGYTAPEKEKPWSVPYALMNFANSDVDPNGQIRDGAPAAQLYNLSNDISQEKNVIAEHPERAAAMRARLEALTDKSRNRRQAK